MAKYRIKVEALDSAEEMRAEYRMGIECEGFCIIAKYEGGHQTAIHDLDTVDIANCMQNDAQMMQCVCIAKGMFDAQEAALRFSETRIMSNLAERLSEMLGDD